MSCNLVEIGVLFMSVWVVFVGSQGTIATRPIEELLPLWNLWSIQFEEGLSELSLAWKIETDVWRVHRVHV